MNISAVVDTDSNDDKATSNRTTTIANNNNNNFNNRFQDYDFVGFVNSTTRFRSTTTSSSSINIDNNNRSDEVINEPFSSEEVGGSMLRNMTNRLVNSTVVVNYDNYDDGYSYNYTNSKRLPLNSTLIRRFNSSTSTSRPETVSVLTTPAIISPTTPAATATSDVISSSSSSLSPSIITSNSSISHLTTTIMSRLNNATTAQPTFTSTPLTPTDFVLPTSPVTTIYPYSDFDDDSLQCFSSPEDYDLITATLCATLMVFGVLYTFYGYRCFKAVLFLTGFIFAAGVIYMICLAESILPAYGNIGISALAGLLFGLITMLVAYVGLFMLGFHLGLLTAAQALVVIYLIAPFVDWIVAPTSAWVIFAVFMALGLTGACGTLYFQRGCAILATVLYGSTMTLVCVDYFVEGFKLIIWFRDKLRDGSGQMAADLDAGHRLLSAGFTKTVTLCPVSWVLLTAWPCSVILGMVVQWCITSRGIDYDNDYNYGVVESSAVRTNQNRARSDESRLEQRQRKYRYLYQVRTAHGDVISQQYIQSLQKKVLPPDDNDLTYTSDMSSHITVIPSDSRTTTMSVA